MLWTILEKVPCNYVTFITSYHDFAQFTAIFIFPVVPMFLLSSVYSFCMTWWSYLQGSKIRALLPLENSGTHRRLFGPNTSAEGRPRLHSWESQKPLILTGYKRLSQATYLGTVAQLINNELEKLRKKKSSPYLL